MMGLRLSVRFFEDTNTFQKYWNTNANTVMLYNNHSYTYTNTPKYCTRMYSKTKTIYEYPSMDEINELQHNCKENQQLRIDGLRREKELFKYRMRYHRRNNEAISQCRVPQNMDDLPALGQEGCNVPQHIYAYKTDYEAAIVRVMLYMRWSILHLIKSGMYLLPVISVN